MNITPDFKMVIIVDEALPLGLQCNTAAVLSLSLGEKIEGLIGPDLKDGTGTFHTGLTQYPLPILKSSSENLSQIYKSVSSDLLLIDITDAAQTTKNYQDYEEKLSSKKTDELKLLGVALAGSDKLVNKLTGNLALLR